MGKWHIGINEYYWHVLRAYALHGKQWYIARRHSGTWLGAPGQASDPGPWRPIGIARVYMTADIAAND